MRLHLVGEHPRAAPVTLTRVLTPATGAHLHVPAQGTTKAFYKFNRGAATTVVKFYDFR